MYNELKFTIKEIKRSKSEKNQGNKFISLSLLGYSILGWEKDKDEQSYISTSYYEYK